MGGGIAQVQTVALTKLPVTKLSNCHWVCSELLGMPNELFCDWHRAKLVHRIHEDEMKSQNYQVSRGWQPLCACEILGWAGCEPGRVHGVLAPRRLPSPSSRPGSWWVRTSTRWWSSRLVMKRSKQQWRKARMPPSTMRSVLSPGKGTFFSVSGCLPLVW